MGVSENIKKRRIELNLSQQELAKRMGYTSRSTIAKIEKGENEVSENKLIHFAKVLNTSIEYLKTGIDGKIGYSIFEEGSSGSKNIAIILAGGKSTRNQQNIPNQFINVLGKPVIIYCLEAYQKHPAIDDIYVVCLKGWEDILYKYIEQYHIDKVKGIIDAGETGILSIKNGIIDVKSKYDVKDTIIFQEATRPLVTEEMISKLLNTVKKSGGAVTCEAMNEYVQFELSDDNIENSKHSEYLNRHRIVTIQSPEAYRLETIINVFKEAEKVNHKFDETCMAMLLYNLGYELQYCEGNHNNIKVVRQEDIAILSGLLKLRL